MWTYHMTHMCIDLRGSKMIDIVKSTCIREGLINKGDGIVVALSGGADSLSMLHCLIELKDEFDLKLIAVHLNHMFRGKLADDDEEYVKEICKKLGVECRTFQTDIDALSKKLSMSFEEAGRYERYRLFNMVMEEKGYSKIAVAQNKNDQAETVLMRIIRGTGLTGLKGISYMRDGYIIRPILDVERELIDMYCLENNLSPRVDHTNFQDIYFRNKVRLKLIPFLKENFSKSVMDSIVKIARLSADDDDFFDMTAKDKIVEAFEIDKDVYTTELQDFNSMHISLRRRIIRKIVENLLGDLNNFSYGVLNEIINMVDRGNHGANICWGNLRFEVIYGKFIIKTDKQLFYNWQFSYTILDIEDFTGYKEDNSTVYIDFDNIVGELFLRYRQDGDKFSPLGLNGKKKLKDYFIDKKVEKDARNNIPLICDDRGIVWVYSYAIDNRVKITGNTKKIVELKIW